MLEGSRSPDVAGRPSWRLRSANFGIRWLLTLTAILLVAGPILIALKLHENGLEVGSQYAIQTARVSPRDVARWRSVGAGLPTQPPPVVLAYHDIRPARGTSGNRSAPVSGVYNVTPEHLDQQLTSLQDAGYSSLTAAQYIAYLRGGPVRSRSALITFDGSTQGLWSYADQILARHQMHGVSFLSPRAIETHWTRFLSWAEIQRMAGSGRWDFESALNRAALTGHTAGVDRALVALRESIQTFRRHLLGVPRLLTLPMPVRGAAQPLDLAFAARIVQAPFVTEFGNGETLAPPTSRRAAAGKLIGRIEVSRTTDPDKLLRTVASLTGMPVSSAKPLADPDRWTTGILDTSPVAVSRTALRLTVSGSYENAAYLEDSSADWNNYVVDLTVRGLQTSAADGASVIVRVGSRGPLALRLSARSASVIRSRGSSNAVLRHSRLFTATVHRVRVVVRPRLTRFTVDQLVTFAVPAAASPTSAGGIGLSGFRQDTHRPWPVFSGLSIRPATTRSARPDTLKPISLYSPSPLGASSLWVRGPFARAAVRATGHSVQFTGPRIRDFAQFAPGLTSGWTGYVFKAAVEKLGPGDKAYLFARVGSVSQVLAVVGPRLIKVFSGARGAERLIAARALANNSIHRLSVRVLARRTLVTADGTPIVSMAARRGATGGVAVGAKRIQGQSWPRLTAMTVAPIR